MKIRCLTLLLLIGFTFSGAALAQNSLARQLEQCRTEQNALKRLVCYDEIELIAVTRAMPPATVTANNSDSAVAPQVERRSPQSNFGIEHRQAISEATDQQTAVIAAIRRSARRELIIELDNGQIWRQNGTEQIDLNVGDQISIKRGMFGAFYLSKPGINRTLKVTRSN